MPNMTYCMFYNTYLDLKDCEEALENKEFDELSESERKYAKKLIELCRQIADDNEDRLED